MLRSGVQISMRFLPGRGEAAADDTKDRRSGWTWPAMSRVLRTAPVGALPSVPGKVCIRRPKADGIGAFASVGDQQRLAQFWLKILVGHRARCSRPFVAGEPGFRRQALVSWVLFEGALVGSVTRWPLRGREKYAFPTEGGVKNTQKAHYFETEEVVHRHLGCPDVGGDPLPS